MGIALEGLLDQNVGGCKKSCSFQFLWGAGKQQGGATGRGRAFVNKRY